MLLAHDTLHSTPHELERSSGGDSRAVPRADVAADPVAAARAALAVLAACDRLAVHFDVDCIDFTDAPLSENTGRNAGLRQDDAFAALAEVLRDPRVSALTITELNPEHGAEDGSTLSAFCERLVAGARRRVPATRLAGDQSRSGRLRAVASSARDAMPSLR